ncbi:FAD-dependent oxidoreductase [Streptomyces sp. NPDC058683]|uniref:FAD-dependent oxidoreductase n=1 Tax=Streptomyces sp. NPDC058683 TaxID=3346597 RepID=UPI00364B9B06
MSGTAFRVAVVGSGPSGAYVAQELSEQAGLDAVVDVYERLPVPFGLVRYGVAPDHQRIKSIVGSLAEIFAHPRVRFLGNVRVGTDITFDELRQRYDAVVVACGASADRRLSIPGEDLPGVASATDFVAWYSGHPDAAVDRFALTAETAVIIGVGNVALDVARMLCRTPDELRRTDVPQHVVDVLAASTVRKILVVGRRGPAHAKFSSKELGELRELSDTDVLADPDDLADDQAAADSAQESPSTRRMLATLRGYAAGTPTGTHRRTVRFAFFRTPVAFVGEDSARGLRVIRRGPGRAEADEVLPAQFFVRSVGYRGLALPGLPFQPDTGTVPHAEGRVMDGTGQLAGVYVAGWIKRGPSGVIGTNKQDAVATVAAITQDRARAPKPSRQAFRDPLLLLRERGVDVVEWSAWQRIDAAEEIAGRPLGRGRVKLHERGRMLAVAAAQN